MEVRGIGTLAALVASQRRCAGLETTVAGLQQGQVTTLAALAGANLVP